MERARRAFGDSDDLVKVAYGAAAGVALGALGPWFSPPGGDVLGTDGGYYGTYVLVLAGMAGLVVFSWAQAPAREKLIGIAICAGGCLALMVTDVIRFEGTVQIGWGLWIGIASCVLLLAVAARLYQLNPA